MLEFILNLLVITLIIIIFTDESRIKFLQNFSLLVSGIIFLCSLYLLCEFDTNYANFQGFFSSPNRCNNFRMTFGFNN